jgi:TatD DNase family protein
VDLFDTHAHLTDPALADETGVIGRALAAGVSRILTVATSAASSRQCLALAERQASVWAAIGIHPNEADEAAPGDWEAIVELAQHPRVVALGETGLDLYWQKVPLPVQIDYFERHLELAQERDLPVVIHLRQSAQEILRVLHRARSRGPLRGVMHSFTGTAEEAAAFLELGLHLSFAGMVTFKKSHALREVAAMVPADRLLIETDAPYLSPEPLRGRHPNEPARLVHTAACLAEVRGVNPADLAAQTTANAQRLFRVP